MDSWRQDVFKYMSGIIEAKKQKPIIINGVKDHVHLFIGIVPSGSLSDIVRDVKNNSTNFINSQNYLPERFSWQEGFGAFSYGRSQIDRVYQYILNQEKHHRNQSFKIEYLNLLRKFGVDYNEKYLFDWLE